MHSYLRRPFWKVTDEIPLYAANWKTVETIYSNCNHSLTCKLQNTQYEGSYFEVISGNLPRLKTDPVIPRRP